MIAQGTDVIVCGHVGAGQNTVCHVNCFGVVGAVLAVHLLGYQSEGEEGDAQSCGFVGSHFLSSLDQL